MTADHRTVKRREEASVMLVSPQELLVTGEVVLGECLSRLRPVACDVNDVVDGDLNGLGI